MYCSIQLWTARVSAFWAQRWDDGCQPKPILCWISVANKGEKYYRSLLSEHSGGGVLISWSHTAPRVGGSCAARFWFLVQLKHKRHWHSNVCSVWSTKWWCGQHGRCHVLFALWYSTGRLSNSCDGEPVVTIESKLTVVTSNAFIVSTITCVMIIIESSSWLRGRNAIRACWSSQPPLVGSKADTGLCRLHPRRTIRVEFACDNPDCHCGHKLQHDDD